MQATAMEGGWKGRGGARWAEPLPSYCHSRSRGTSGLRRQAPTAVAARSDQALPFLSARHNLAGDIPPCSTLATTTAGPPRRRTSMLSPCMP